MKKYQEPLKEEVVTTERAKARMDPPQSSGNQVTMRRTTNKIEVQEAPAEERCSLLEVETKRDSGQ